MKGKCTRLLWLYSDGTQLLEAIVKVKESLAVWYDGVPQPAHLERSLSDPENAAKDTIYYIHLLHLDAIMFTCRRALEGFRTVQSREGLTQEQRDVLNEALNDGLVAAEQSSRLLALLVGDMRTPSHCWVAM